MKLIITTSREPSRRTRSFVKDLVQTIPHAEKVNRGKATLIDLKNLIIRKGAYGLIMVLEKKANPSALVFYIPAEDTIKRLLMIRIRGIRLSREISDYQRPLGIRELVIRPSSIPEGLPSEVGNALIDMFKPKIYSGEPPPRSIEIVLTGSKDEAEISFICTSSGKYCGPIIRAFKVLRFKE
ncbi:MAG TPA: hypothetical protein ENG05_03335 [Acidilobales archaeon]|nr:hypothetical protein [Acidilobales archaeon]